jgi:hypothetical protein
MNLPSIIQSNQVATLAPNQLQKIKKFANSPIWQNIASPDKATSQTQISKLNRSVCFKDVQGKVSVALLKKVNKDALYSILEAFVVYTLDAMVIKNVNQPQIDGIVDVIVANYWASIPEVLLILKQGRAGQYGKNYQSLTAETIADWFDQYWNKERAVYYENKAISEKRAIEKGEFDPKVQKTISNIAKQNPKLN